MSETTATTVTPAAPGGETLPVIPASVVTPVATETAPAATPTETAPVTPPTEVVPETPPATGAAPVEPAATGEALPTGETAPDASGSEAPAAPVYSDFTFPEGVNADAELVGLAKEVFGKHALTQEVAQELVDLHTTTATKMVQAYQAEATKYWADQSKAWVAELKDDAQVGGNRFQTSTDLARAALSEGLSKADQTRLWSVLEDTHVGDHPVLFKRMAQLGRERQQVLQLTGTTTWADAMKKLREPAAAPPGIPAKVNGGGTPAQRRYAPRTQ